MKLLTFLGTADYKETTYCLNEHCYLTRYCPAALAHIFRPDSTLVVVTEAARAMHFDRLATEIASLTRLVPVFIPDGHSEADLWTIFDALTGQVDEKDTLIVDLTNGFRSLPFLSFLAVAYLRIAKRVDVKGVYYGAWDARDQEANRTPVFNLTPFVTLLDWSIATDRFERFGDAGDLARLLRAEMPPGPLMGSDEQARSLGKSLQKAAEVMEAVSLALRVNRPYESMEASQKLVDALEQHRAAVESRSRPFALLTDRIQDAYRDFALTEPLDRANWKRNLAIQLDMVGWYLDKGQVIQAVTLAREWLVSVLVYRLGVESMTKYQKNREWVEYALCNEVERHKPKEKQREPLSTPLNDALFALPQCGRLGRLWDMLTDQRNDLAHVVGKYAAEDVLRKARNLYDELRPLGLGVLNEGEPSP